MKTISVSLPPNPSISYPIHIGTHCVDDVAVRTCIHTYSQVMVVCDETVFTLHKDFLHAHFSHAAYCIIPSGEKAKHIDTIQHIWKQMHAAHMDRKSVVIALGGGVTGDMVGFAAATYMRGIDFIQIPTTLLSMVDASVGGKTGINFAGVKNLIGSFQQPVMVIVDMQFLETLPAREMRSSMAEIVKHAVIADATYFTMIEAYAEKPTEEMLKEIVIRSIEIKKEIVEKDPHEKIGLRARLNFGHTIGHAVEALSHEMGNPLTHGEAIAIGMIAESARLVKKELFPEHDMRRLKKLLQKLGLPTEIPIQMTPDMLQKKMQSDKKNEKGEITYVVVQKIGIAA